MSVGRKIDSPSAMQYNEVHRYSANHRNYSPLNVSYNNSQVVDYSHNNHNSNINATQKNVLLTNVKKSDRSFSYNNPGYLINDKLGNNLIVSHNNILTGVNINNDPNNSSGYNHLNLSNHSINQNGAKITNLPNAKSNYNILKSEYGQITDSSPMGYRNLSSSERYNKGNILFTN